jgi:hypothetical protein
MRHMERRVVGVHPPHWASDFVKIGGIPVKLIKEVVELLPTTAVILLRPAHFSTVCTLLPRQERAAPSRYIRRR